MNTPPPGSRYEPRPGGGDLTPRHTPHTTPATERPAMMFLDTSHNGATLNATPYRTILTSQLDDDGIIDRVAVDRTLAGDTLRLSPRELLCVIHDGKTAGMSDDTLARLLGCSDKGIEWVRARHFGATDIDSLSDSELPGMWERADFIGGATDCAA